MNDNELHIARKVRQVLDYGVENIAPAKIERLREARMRALKVQKQPSVVFGLAWAGNVAGQMMSATTVSRVWLPLAALVIGLFLTVQWQQENQHTITVAEAEEIDSALLTSDLPINAYLDQGFDAWLKRDTAEE